VVIVGLTQLNATGNYGHRCVHRYVRIYFNITSWCNENLSRCALNALTELASTTEFGKLFHILTIRAIKNVSINCSEKYDLEVYNQEASHIAYF